MPSGGGRLGGEGCRAARRVVESARDSERRRYDPITPNRDLNDASLNRRLRSSRPRLRASLATIEVWTKRPAASLGPPSVAHASLNASLNPPFVTCASLSASLNGTASSGCHTGWLASAAAAPWPRDVVRRREHRAEPTLIRRTGEVQRRLRAPAGGARARRGRADGSVVPATSDGFVVGGGGPSSGGLAASLNPGGRVVERVVETSSGRRSIGLSGACTFAGSSSRNLRARARPPSVAGLAKLPVTLTVRCRGNRILVHTLRRPIDFDTPWALDRYRVPGDSATGRVHPARPRCRGAHVATDGRGVRGWPERTDDSHARTIPGVVDGQAAHSSRRSLGSGNGART